MAMNNFVKSFTILLHAIVMTAVLTSQSMPEKNSAIQFPQNSGQFVIQPEAIATTNL